MMKKSIPVCVLLAFPNNVMAESPSYPETLGYITNLLSYEAERYSFRYGHLSYVTQVVSEHRRCILEKKRYVLSSKSAEPEFESASRTDFSVALPSSFEGESNSSNDWYAASYIIRHKYKKDADDGFHWYWSGSSWKHDDLIGPEFKIEKIQLLGSNLDFYGPKLVRALRHFSELCSAKKELF